MNTHDGLRTVLTLLSDTADTISARRESLSLEASQSMLDNLDSLRRELGSQRIALEVAGEGLLYHDVMGAIGSTELAVKWSRERRRHDEATPALPELVDGD